MPSNITHHVVITTIVIYIYILPSDWYLDEFFVLAMPKKDGWGGLADGPWVMEVVVSGWIGEQMQVAL